MDEADETAIGIVGVNNVHLTSEEVEDDFRVCEVVEGHQVRIAQMRILPLHCTGTLQIMSGVNDPDDVSKGVVYACEYQDLRDAFEEVPDLGDLGMLL